MLFHRRTQPEFSFFCGAGYGFMCRRSGPRVIKECMTSSSLTFSLSNRDKLLTLCSCRFAFESNGSNGDGFFGYSIKLCATPLPSSVVSASLCTTRIIVSAAAGLNATVQINYGISTFPKETEGVQLESLHSAQFVVKVQSFIFSATTIARPSISHIIKT